MSSDKIKSSYLYDLLFLWEGKPLSSTAWLISTYTHWGKKSLGKRNGCYKRKSQSNSMHAYLDEWQRAYCVSVLMLLQSARETQDRFFSIIGKKLNVRYTQVYDPRLNITRWGIFSNSSGPIQENTQVATLIDLHPPKRTGSHSRKDDLAHLASVSFGLQHLFFSLPSWASIAIQRTIFLSISFSSASFYALLALRKHLKIYKWKSK